jgi:hypothetical protein
MAYRQADLAKIGKEGFDIIDKYYGRPKRNIGRPAPPPGYPHGNNFCLGSEVPPLPQMKEAVNKTNNIASQIFRVVDRKAK